jgi:hypothetical protein
MQKRTVPLLLTTPGLKKRGRRSTFLWSYRVGGAQSGRGKIPARVSGVIGFFLHEDKTTPSERCMSSFVLKSKRKKFLSFSNNFDVPQMFSLPVSPCWRDLPLKRYNTASVSERVHREFRIYLNAEYLFLFTDTKRPFLSGYSAYFRKILLYMLSGRYHLIQVAPST